MKTKDKKCKNLVHSRLKGRIDDLKKLFRAYQEGNENSVDNLGTFNEYGLGFDYVPADTFGDQTAGYFRYQLSWGGPSDEFRYYTDAAFSIDRIEYWYLDWFDGAKATLSGSDYELLDEIFDFFKEIGSVEAEFEKAD